MVNLGDEFLGHCGLSDGRRAYQRNAEGILGSVSQGDTRAVADREADERRTYVVLADDPELVCERLAFEILQGEEASAWLLDAAH